MICTFHVARIISVHLVHFRVPFLSSLALSSFILCSTFVTTNFLLCGFVSSKPNPQTGGPGYPFLSGSSPLTYLAWEAYATASIALGIM
jgi:hypothetical protein